MKKLALYADLLYKCAQAEQVRSNFFIAPVSAHRQEWWVLQDGTPVDVPETHGKTAVDILQKKNVKIPMDDSGIPDFMAAMGMMFNNGAARVHKFGNDIVITFNKLTPKIIDGVTDLLMAHNVPLNNSIKLQSGSIGNFTEMRVSFLDLLESGNNPKNLAKIHQTRNFGEFKLAMKKLAQDSVNTPNVTIQPGKPEANCALEILKLWKPDYFVGVKSIVIGPSADYGHVESGPGKDPAIIYLNADRIVSEAGGKQGGKEAALATAKVIAHEKGHIASFNPQQGFVGGETPAEIQEHEFENWLNSGGLQRVEALPSYQALASK